MRIPANTAKISARLRILHTPTIKKARAIARATKLFLPIVWWSSANAKVWSNKTPKEIPMISPKRTAQIMDWSSHWLNNASTTSLEKLIHRNILLWLYVGLKNIIGSDTKIKPIPSLAPDSAAIKCLTSSDIFSSANFPFSVNY